MPNNLEEPLDGLQLETRSESGGQAPAPALVVPGLTILSHPDVRRVGERAALTGLAAGRTELLARGELLFAQPGDALRRPLEDPYLSRRPIELAPGAGAGSVRLRCGATRTPVTAAGEPIAGECQLAAAEIARGVVLLLGGRVALLLSPIELTIERLPDFELIGDAPAMTRLRRDIQRVARLDIAVLLRGETGTGKELVARALHQGGPRRGRPFVAVNMGAIPATLAAAELFGATRGAFTGADRPRQGYFGRADGGTLFLDEIGETPPEVQVLLLRALESHEVQPVGGGEPRQVDVRVIAATDAPLDEAVAEGRFKAPLLHRLSGYEIRLPALRTRREDFGRLFFHFLAEELQELGAAARLTDAAGGARPWMPAPLVAWLADRDWPGNVRQLRNVARQIVVACHDAAEAVLDPEIDRLLAPSDAARADGLGGDGGRAADPSGAGASGAATSVGGAGAAAPKPAAAAARRTHRRLEDVTDDEILDALRANHWRIKAAAAQLGVARASLYDRIDTGSRFHKAADLTREQIAGCAAECGGDVARMAEALEVSKQGLKRRLTELA